MKHTPVGEGERIISLDIIRGFAIFGIFLVNMPSFQWPDLVGQLYFVSPDLSPVDQWIRAFFDVFVQGKFYTIFSFLFGLGFYIFIKRAEEKRLKPYRLFSRRLTILAIFGLLHLIFLWYGDILLTYALAGFLLMLFYKRKTKTILIWIASLVCLMTLVLSLNLLIPEEYMEEILVESETIGQEKVEEAILVYQEGSYGEWLSYRLKNEVVPIFQNTPFVIPVVLFMFLFGLYAGKKGIFQDVPSHLPFIKKVWWVTLVLSIPFSIAIVLAHLGVIGAGLYHTVTIQVLLNMSGPTLALFYIASIVMLLQKEVWQRRLKPFSYVGRMALTNYILQTFVGVGIYTGLGFFGKMNLLVGTIICIVVFLLQMIFSYYWLKKFRYGPLEWVWRTLTYGRI